jgi:hypothetical protein
MNCGADAERVGNSHVALVLYRRAAAIDPSFSQAHFNTAVVYAGRLGDYLTAVVLNERAAVCDPAQFPVYVNWADCNAKKGDFIKAARIYAWAEVIAPDNDDLLFSSALVFFALGRFAEGWVRYESRWTAPLHAAHATAAAGTLLDSLSYSGPGSKRVLVWAEQGVGDEVMFGGLVGEFRGLCGELLLQVDRRLMGLFERALPGVRVFERGKPVPSELYDEQIPMGSLGKWLRPSRESFEGKGGRYLKAQEGLGRRLRAELGVGASEKLIGLSWRSASAETGAARSLSLKALVGALQGVEGARFLNLQYGEVSEELRALREETGVAVLTHPGIDNREDLEGLAGLIEGCDLVVSVGNATAHLSGALGQKTWVLLPYVAGWRWLHEGERCPWYQSVRLYRQSKPGDWTQPLQRVCHALTAGH